MNTTPFIMLLTPPTGGPEEFLAFAAVYLVVILIALMPQYLMNSIALFKISRRRGIRYAWLSWVPLGSSWVLGCISDQYQQLVLGKTKKRRQWLLLCNALSVLLYIALIVLMIVCVTALPEEMDPSQTAPAGAAGMTIGLVVLMVLSLAVGLAGSVWGWMAIYDLFRSCDPRNGILYFGICLGVRLLAPSFAIVKEILFLVVSGKDLGMPSREAAVPIVPELLEESC